MLALGTHSEVKGRNSDPARHMVALATDDSTQDPEGNYVQLVQFNAPRTT